MDGKIQQGISANWWLKPITLKSVNVLIEPATINNQNSNSVLGNFVSQKQLSVSLNENILQRPSQRLSLPRINTVRPSGSEINNDEKDKEIFDSLKQNSQPVIGRSSHNER